MKNLDLPDLFIAPPCSSAAEAASARQAQLTKPPGSLGMLESLAIQFAAYQGQAHPEPLRPAITVFAADHGVTAEGVSAFPAEVTPQMVANFVAGGAAICVLAKAISAPLEVVDVGVAADISHLPIVHAKVRYGTANLRHQPAMSREDALAALHVGREAARRHIGSGANLLIAGDMGIGNTTASAALICLLTGLGPLSIVGRGTGVDDQSLIRKRIVVMDALARLMPIQGDVLERIAHLGGLEIVAMAGFYLEAAAQGVPSLVDGFIASAAALCAHALYPEVRDWLLASHCSQEMGHRQALAALGLAPLIDLQMRLGEGSGAAMCFPLFDLAVRLHNEMHTFAQAGIAGGAL